MKKLITYSAALAVLGFALTWRTPAPAASYKIIDVRVVTKPSNVLSAREVNRLRRAITSNRSRTWHFQDIAGVARTPTRYAERKTHSVAYLGWLDQQWSRRQRVAHRLAVTHPRIAHTDLWLCIHGTLNPYGHWEARTWNNEDTGGNGHYGGLQMSWSWGYSQVTHSGYGLAGDPAHYTEYEQMAAAERGYRTNAYSQAWLLGQWYHPECLQYA